MTVGYVCHTIGQLNAHSLIVLSRMASDFIDKGIFVRADIASGKLSAAPTGLSSTARIHNTRHMKRHIPKYRPNLLLDHLVCSILGEAIFRGCIRYIKEKLPRRWLQ